MRLASVVASALLVFTFLGDVALGSMLGAARQTALESAPAQSETGMLDTQAGSLPAEETLPNVMSAPEQRTMESTPTPGLLSAAPAPTLDPTAEIIQRMTAAPPGMGGGEPAATPPPEGLTMQALEAPTTEADGTLTMKSGAEDVPYAAPESAVEAEEPYAAPMEEMRAGESAVPFDYTRLFRPIEIALALIAITTGIGAFLARRR
jgi:hypothetical protein